MSCRLGASEQGGHALLGRRMRAEERHHASRDEG